MKRWTILILVLVFLPSATAICSLNTAFWNENSVMKNNGVSMLIQGNDCVNEQVSLEIREVDTDYNSGSTNGITQLSNVIMQPGPAQCFSIETFEDNAVYLYEKHFYPNAAGNSRITDADVADVLPGTIIYIHEGDYSHIYIGFGLEGTEQNPIKFTSFPGEGRPKFNCAGYGEALKGGGFKYTTFENFDIEACPSNGINLDENEDVGSHHIIIRNMNINNVGQGPYLNNNDGMKLSGIDNYYILNNTITRTFGGDAFDCVGCHYGLLAFNYVVNGGFNPNSGNFQDARGGFTHKGGSHDVLLFGNYVENGLENAMRLGGSSGSYGFRPYNATWEGLRIIAVSNIMVNQGAAPIEFKGCIDCMAINNIAYDENQFPDGGIKFTRGGRERTITPTEGMLLDPAQNNTIANNIFIWDNPNLLSNHNHIIAQGSGEGIWWLLDTMKFFNNLWFDASGTELISEMNYGTAITANEIIAVNPLITDRFNRDFSLLLGSPAISVGKHYSEYPADYNSNCYTNQRSIGAIESNPILSGAVSSAIATWNAQYIIDDDITAEPEYVLKAELVSNPSEFILSNQLIVTTNDCSERLGNVCTSVEYCTGKYFSDTVQARCCPSSNSCVTDTNAPSFAGLNSTTSGGDGSSVILSWNDAIDENLVTYRIYYSENLGTLFNNYQDSTTQNFFTINSLVQDSTYYFAVRAEDSASNIEQNTNSLEATATVITVYEQGTTNNINFLATLTNIEKNIVTDNTYDVKLLENLAVSGSCDAQNICGTSNGLVNYWDFEEGTGNTANDDIGNFNANLESPTWETGKYGTALSFNGGLDKATDGTGDSTGNVLTLSVWIYWLGENGEDQGIFGKINRISSSNEKFHFERKVSGELQFARGTSNVARFGVDIPRTNEWVHLLVVQDTGDARLYIDGVEIDSRPINVLGGLLTASNIIGNLGPTGQVDSNKGFNGYIDELRIYNRVLSQSEITELFTAQNPTIYFANGEVLGDIIDATLNVNIIDVSWNEEILTNTNIQTYIRASDSTYLQTSNLPIWIPVINGQNLGINGRYIQYKTELTTTTNSFTPVLKDIRITVEGGNPLVACIPTTSDEKMMCNSLDDDCDNYVDEYCYGDNNGDSVVNLIDLGRFGINFQTSLGDINYNADSDYNNDNTINIFDFVIFSQLYNNNAYCGDTIQQLGEECDDGNNIARDGCDNCSID